jgi:hypothetical protein
MGARISFTVDTLLKRFRSLAFSDWRNLPSDTAAGYYVARYESLHLMEVPYIEIEDGSLVCTIPPEEFSIPYRQDPLTVAIEVLHFPSDWRRDEGLTDIETWTEFHLNTLSPSEAYIRITLK